MAEAEVKERVLWRGQICTVIARKRGKLDIRDSFGFVEYNVPKRETEELSADDDRKTFRA